jgi:hypothetical protein
MQRTRYTCTLRYVGNNSRVLSLASLFRDILHFALIPSNLDGGTNSWMDYNDELISCSWGETRVTSVTYCRLLRTAAHNLRSPGSNRIELEVGTFPENVFVILGYIPGHLRRETALLAVTDRISSSDTRSLRILHPVLPKIFYINFWVARFSDINILIFTVKTKTNLYFIIIIIIIIM